MGHLLREAAAPRWFRIHSLPGGKRLPTNNLELAEIVRRHNTVATAVLGIGASSIAFLSEWSASRDFSSWPIADSAPDWQLSEDDLESVSRATFRYRAFRWRPAEFDREIVATARDEVGPIAVLSLSTSGVYCPYDGGADLFVPEAGDVEPLRALFKEWLSELPSRL